MSTSERRWFLQAAGTLGLASACTRQEAKPRAAAAPVSSGAPVAPPPSLATAPVKGIGDVQPLPHRVPLRTGTTGNPLNLPLWLAIDKGYLGKAGFDLAPYHIQGSASREFPLKLARNELDVAQGSPTAALFQQVIEGFDIRIPASLGVEKKGRMPSGQLVILKDQAASIHTVADLKGRAVDGLSPGPTGFLATQAIRSAGLDPSKDVKLTFRGRSPQDIFALVENHAADVLSMQGDFALQLEKQGKVVRWLTFADVVPWYQPSLLTMSSGFAQDRAAVAKFLEVYLLACREINAAAGAWNPELTRLVQKWAKVEDASVVTDQGGVPYFDPNGTVNRESLRKVQDFWLETKQIAQRVDADRLIDTTGLAQALGQIGLV